MIVSQKRVVTESSISTWRTPFRERYPEAPIYEVTQIAEYRSRLDVLLTVDIDTAKFRLYASELLHEESNSLSIPD